MNVRDERNGRSSPPPDVSPPALPDAVVDWDRPFRHEHGDLSDPAALKPALLPWDERAGA